MCLSSPPLVAASTTTKSPRLTEEERDPANATKNFHLLATNHNDVAQKHHLDEAEVHDYFNLVALLPMIFLNAMNWDWSMLLDMLTDPTTTNITIQDAWTDEWFSLFSFYTLSYFCVDLCYILMVPTSVKSPSTIVQHHIVSLVYLSTPIFYPSFRYAMGLGLSVELNTWLLIARRRFHMKTNSHVKKQKNENPDVSSSNMLSYCLMMTQRYCVSFLFYSTWFVIRLGLYPYLWLDIVNRYNHLSAASSSRVNIWLLILPLHTIFMVMNIKWTVDLTLSKIRYWQRRCGGDDKEVEPRDNVAKGL